MGLNPFLPFSHETANTDFGSPYFGYLPCNRLTTISYNYRAFANIGQKKTPAAYSLRGSLKSDSENAELLKRFQVFDHVLAIIFFLEL